MVIKHLRLIVLVGVLLPFVAYSTWVVIDRGYFGFLRLAAAEPWGMQILVDLVIALSLFAGWMFRDARQRGLTAWPYFVATLALGSVGALAYLIRRELARVAQSPARELPRDSPASVSASSSSG
jgi:hypothetical protein